jgi:hypothetical protein
VTRAELVAQFEAEEARGAQALADELAIKDAGGWDAYVALREIKEN